MDYLMKILSYTILVGLTIIITFSQAALDKSDADFFDSPEVKVDLWHSFGHALNEGSPTSRGSVNIRNFRGPKYTSEQNTLSSSDLKKLKELAADDGYYFLTAKIKLPSGQKEFNSFAPARSVLDSGLTDVLRIHLTPSGEIFSISYGVRQISSTPIVSSKFNTTVFVHNGDVGPIPDTAPYLEKLEMERIAKERGEDGKDNRSFIAKYWLYIVPVALLVILSSANGQEGGGGGS